MNAWERRAWRRAEERQAANVRRRKAANLERAQRGLPPLTERKIKNEGEK